MAALLLLTALGIDQETIFQDYMLTNQYMERALAAALTREDFPFPADIAREVFLVYEENLRSYVRSVELEYGSVPNFLELALGVGPKEIETLEGYYLEW